MNGEHGLLIEGAAKRDSADDVSCVTARTDLRDFLTGAGIDTLDPATIDQVDARVTEDGEVVFAFWGELR